MAIRASGVGALLRPEAPDAMSPAKAIYSVLFDTGSEMVQLRPSGPSTKVVFALSWYGSACSLSSLARAKGRRADR